MKNSSNLSLKDTEPMPVSILGNRDSIVSLKESTDAHAASKANPHGVTASQVGALAIKGTAVDSNVMEGTGTGEG